MQETPKIYNYDKGEANFFENLWHKYFPFWPLYLVLMFLCVGATYFYLKYQVPLYGASATLLIKDESKGGSGETQMLQQLDALNSNKSVENEIEIIKSRKLAKEVVKNLHLYASVFAEGRVNDLSAYVFSPITIRARHPDSINGSGKVYFSFDEAKGVVKIEGGTYKLDSFYRFPYGEIKFIRNSYAPLSLKKASQVSPPVKPYYFLIVDVKSIAYGLIGSLNVAPISQTSSVLKLGILDPVAQKAEDILNEWIACYNRAAVEDKNRLAANTLRFIDERLRYIVQDLDSVELSVQNFKSANKIVDIGAQGSQFLGEVNNNDRQLAELNVRSMVLGQVENYVLGKSTEGGIVPATLGVSDPILMQLLNNLYSTEAQYEALRKTNGEAYPKVAALADQITKMRGNILENLQNQKKGLEAAKAQLFASNNKYTGLLSSLPKKERQLIDISRQRVIKDNIYTFLLQKREETALSSASTIADNRVVDIAESNYSPIRANSKMMYTMAILGALVLGIGFVIVKDAVTRTIMTREEIEKFTTMPILGEVAYDRSKKSIIIAEGRRTVIAEQFRHIRTYLGYLGINSRRKKILITSTISGEGKSFIAVNLGISLALMGKKVALVGLDLRKPRLDTILAVPKNIGVSNYLIGDAFVEDLIKPTEVNVNLFVVPSGPIPPNPSELLTNGRLSELFECLEKLFDYVIIDTAPTSPVTDAFILMPLCDATLYVVRQGYTPKSAVQKLDELYRLNGEKNMAIVFNGTKGRGIGSYRYGYGYGYGYGYHEEEKKPKKGIKAFF